MKNAPTKQYVTAKNPLQTETFTMPADFKKNQRLIYYCDKTNKQYDIENLIAENLELKRKLNIDRECTSKIEYETLLKEDEVNARTLKTYLHKL
jgi:hypothetical protein